MLAEERGVELRYVPVLEDFTLDMEAYAASLDGAKLVCVVHTSNVLGVRNPLEEIIELAHGNGSLSLLMLLKACLMNELISNNQRPISWPFLPTNVWANWYWCFAHRW